jgi:predicted PurR-regulated permease PerM
MPNSKFVVASFLSLLVLSLVLVVQIFWSLITPIVFALVLLSIFHPLYRWFLSKLKGRSILAATFCVLLIFILVFLPFGFFVSHLSGQAFEYYQQLNSSEIFKQLLGGFSNDHPWIKAVREFALKFGLNISTQTLVDEVKELMRKFGELFYGALGQIASNSLRILLDAVLTFVILFALFVRGRDLKTYLMQLAPLPEDEQERLMHQFGDISRAVFLGNGVIIVLEGILGGFGFWLFDIAPGTFWGVLIGIAAFVPAVGAFIIILPAALILLANGDSSQAFLYFAYNIIVFTSLELYVKTKFIGGKSKLQAVLVLLSIIGGVQVFGAFGIFYGPMVVTMCLSLAEIYKEHYRAALLNLKAPSSQA